MALSASGRREKGADAEREIVRLLRAEGWHYAGRTSDGRKQNGRSDILNGPQGCALEIKRHERLNVPQAFDQLTADAGDLRPILIHRPSRHEWMATLPLADLLPLLKLAER
jgi:hypothetical protein